MRYFVTVEILKLFICPMYVGFANATQGAVTKAIRMVDLGPELELKVVIGP
jgi:hypothetical protein